MEFHRKTMSRVAELHQCARCLCDLEIRTTMSAPPHQQHSKLFLFSAPSLPRSPLPPLPALTLQKSAPPLVERELCGHRAAGIRFQSSVNRNCSTDKHTTSVIGLQQVIDRRQGGENGGIRYVVSGCRGPTVCVLQLVKVG